MKKQYKITMLIIKFQFQSGKYTVLSFCAIIYTIYIYIKINQLNMFYSLSKLIHMSRLADGWPSMLRSSHFSTCMSHHNKEKGKRTLISLTTNLRKRSDSDCSPCLTCPGKNMAGSYLSAIMKLRDKYKLNWCLWDYNQTTGFNIP